MFADTSRMDEAVAKLKGVNWQWSKHQNIKVIFPRKKTNSVVSTVSSNIFEVMLQNTIFHGIFREYYNLFNNKFNPEILPGNITTRSLYLSNYLIYRMCVGLYEQKRHILVIPNWNESDYDALYDVANTTPNFDFNYPEHEFAPNPVLAVCLWPIWKKLVNGYMSVAVALPQEWSLLRKIFEVYGIDIVDCSKPYSLGEDSYSGFTITNMPSDMPKFDVVQLVGHDRPEEGVTYNATDIKNDFKRYCNDDFLLHDIYRPKGSFQEMMRQTTLGTYEYRGIVGVENEKALQSLHELNNWIQTTDHGLILNNNNDSDVADVLPKILNMHGTNRLLHTDSDLSATELVNPLDKVSENGFIETFTEASRVIFEKQKNQYVAIF
tara:strand:+ start:180 stop:1316 length:1137 start_codon:yes stop_codon:yes gene_type:complete